MKTYIKKMPTLKAHKINFATKEGILDIVDIMEFGHFSLVWPVGNEYPCIRFNDVKDMVEYSHGDYLVWDDNINQFQGYKGKAFEKCWEEINE